MHANEGQLADPGKNLYIGQDGFKIPGFLWKCVGEDQYEVMSEVPETETHLNLEALDEILKSQPDQELWAHLNQGVNYFFPLRNQITCLAHLTTLSKSWHVCLGSNIVTSSGSLQDTFLYLLVSNSAPIVRAQDKGARIFGVGLCCY